MPNYLTQVQQQEIIVGNNGEVKINLKPEYAGKRVIIVVWTEGWIKKMVENQREVQDGNSSKA